MMTMYNELIKALRLCGNYEDREGCAEECPYFYDRDCPKRIMIDAAAALEAAEKRIVNLLTALHLANEKLAYVDCQPYTEIDGEEMIDDWVKTLVYDELHTQLPKEGEWIESEDLESAMKGKVVCSICGEPQFALELTNEFVRMKNQKTNYCPNCGAKMDGERKDGTDDGEQ